MYMEAYNWDNITTRNYAQVAEMLRKSMDNLSDRDVWLLERKDSRKPFPKELWEITTVDYQGGHYNISLKRAKQIVEYLRSKSFKEHVMPLILEDGKRMFTPKQKPKQA